jgi:UDP-galactopyranose mutase
MSRLAPIVVHSHLRWDGVWQRPQQILSRLAAERRIAFVEEPICSDASPRLEVRESEGVTVFQPHTPPQEEWLPRVSERNQRIIRDLVAPELAARGFANSVRWHYAPMAIYLRDAVSHTAVVYDCMDELSAFKGAPPELVECERRLMEQADVMFTGGKSMFENKSQRHPNCHRFDSGVDVTPRRLPRFPKTPATCRIRS